MKQIRQWRHQAFVSFERIPTPLVVFFTLLILAIILSFGWLGRQGYL